MGVTIFSLATPLTFLMGFLWFNAFILLSLLMRKLRFPIKFSVAPLMALLILSLFRMFFAIGIPGTTIIESTVILPTIVNLLRYEITILGLSVSVVGILVLVWIVVTVFLLTKLVKRSYNSYWTVMKLTFYSNDDEAEVLLSEIIDSEKCARHAQVFRVTTSKIKVPMAAGIRPYIFLPDVDFTPDELRAILRHEWKHNQDRDYIMAIVANAIVAMFWWNPLAYILRRNIYFALELKCDYFAVPNEDDLDHYMNGIHRMSVTLDSKENTPVTAKTLVSKIDEARDRGKSLSLHKNSRRMRILTNICFCIVIGALFVSSYMFRVQPAFRKVPDIEEFYYFSNWNYEAYRAGENFIIDNGNGSFSLYIDGLHVKDVDNIDDYIAFIPVRKHGGE